jgi:hypothetical protein
MTKTELWTNEQVAKYFGVSESRARHILRNNGIKRVYGYPADEVLAIQRPGQGARTDLKESAMTTTTQLHGYGHYTMSASVKDTVMNFVGEHAADFDIEGLTNAFRDAINAELDGTTIELHGDDFYADYPTPDDSENRIRQAIGDADLGALAEEFDRS